MFVVHARLLSARKRVVVRFDKNKTLPRLHNKMYLARFMNCLWGIDMGGRGGIAVAGQQPSSVQTIMSGRYILAFFCVFCVMCFG